MAFEEDTPKLFESWEEERKARCFLFAFSSIVLNIGVYVAWGWAGVLIGAGLFGISMLRASRDDYRARWNLDPTTGKPKA